MSVINDSYLESVNTDQYIGERVMVWLKRCGKTQVQLGEYLGLKKAVISLKVNGRVGWSARDLAWTAAFLGVPLSELMPEESVEIAQKERDRSLEENGRPRGIRTHNPWFTCLAHPTLFKIMRHFHHVR